MLHLPCCHAAEQRFRSPISSPVPGSFGTPERRRWGPDSTATTSSGLNRKWSSMLDVQGGQSPGKASGRITPRSRTPTTYRNTAGRLLPQPPAAAAAELGRANGMTSHATHITRITHSFTPTAGRLAGTSVCTIPPSDLTP